MLNQNNIVSLSQVNVAYNEIFELESVLTATLECCKAKEFNADYYDLTSIQKVMLSEERNRYINLLSIALEKINILKRETSKIETEILNLKQYTYYSSR